MLKCWTILDPSFFMVIQMAGKKSNGPQSRQRAARRDAEIRAIQKNMESVYGLQRGSVQIVDPATKRNIRDDAKIKRVRKT